MSDRDDLPDVPPELAEAARLIGSVPALDEVTRARLVRAALAATDLTATDSADSVEFAPVRPRARRIGRAPAWLVPAGSVAAAVALVAGIATTATRNGDSGAEQASAERNDADMTLGPVAPDSLRDFGDITDSGRLRALVGSDGSGSSEADDRLGVGESAVESSTLLDSANPSSTVAGGADVLATETSALARRTAETAAACLPGLNPGGATPHLVGTGTHQGSSVVIALATEPEGTLVFVFTPEECRIVSAQLVGSG